MKRALIFLTNVSALAFAMPAMAQQDHGAHGAHGAHAGHQAEASSCTAEHAAMGHCAMPEAEQAADRADHMGHAGHAEHMAHADHAGHGADTAAEAPADHQGHGTPAAEDPNCAPEHAAMGHCTPKSSGPALPQIGTNLPAGDAPAPPPPTTWMADAVWGEGAMAHSRHMMMVENGGQTYKYFRLDGEYSSRKGRDGATWSSEFWYGGDINRLVVTSDGDIALGEGIESADIRVLYSRAIDAYFNVQAGVRQDLEGDYKRTYATIGLDGLAPFWFETEAAAFLSDKGDLTAHVEAEYDLRITQKLVLQPALGLEFSAQNIAEKGTGSGLTDAVAGLRLRYDIVRAFAPYIGVEWGRKFGGTARYARAAGEKVETTNFVFGLRTWF